MTDKEIMPGNQTPESIALAKELKELGVRKKIKQYDWIVDDEDVGIIITVRGDDRYEVHFLRDSTLCDRVHYVDTKLENPIPLYQIHDCLEWLRGKGWSIYNMAWICEASLDIAYVQSGAPIREFDRIRADTILECLLKAMIQVVKEEEDMISCSGCGNKIPMGEVWPSYNHPEAPPVCFDCLPEEVKEELKNKVKEGVNHDRQRNNAWKPNPRIHSPRQRTV